MLFYLSFSLKSFISKSYQGVLLVAPSLLEAPMSWLDGAALQVAFFNVCQWAAGCSAHANVGAAVYEKVSPHPCTTVLR